MKLYLDERGSPWVRALLARSPDELFVAETTLVEVTSALFRAARGGVISGDEARAYAADFLGRVGGDLDAVPLNTPILAQALDLAERHALRGYDCVQLATALVTHGRRIAASLDPLVLVSADGELNAAAQQEGLAVEDPNAH